MAHHGVKPQEAIMLYSGTSAFDQGVIVSPYIVVTKGGVEVNTETFAPSMTLLTRGASFSENAEPDDHSFASNSRSYIRTIQLNITE